MSASRNILRAVWGPLRRRMFAMSASDPEVAHEWMSVHVQKLQRFRALLRVLERATVLHDPRLHLQVDKLQFKGRAGLAAGFDKTGKLAPWHSRLFDFQTIGTFTPHPQAGDTRPRIHRFLNPDGSLKGLINHMKFPNPGALQAAKELATQTAATGITGISIGKGANTDIKKAVYDYLFCYGDIRGNADEHIHFFEVNVSSPNTPGLRDLLTPQYVGEFIKALCEEIWLCNNYFGWLRKELVLKMSPDMPDEHLEVAINEAWRSGIRIVAACNTTMDTEVLPEGRDLPGGRSGRVVREKSLATVRKNHQIAPQMTIIGIGGIGGADCREVVHQYIEAGASLFATYTGFIEDPFIRYTINRAYLDFVG